MMHGNPNSLPAGCRSTKTLGDDMIAKKCRQAYEAYDGGNRAFQNDAYHTRKESSGGKIHPRDDGAAVGDEETTCGHGTNDTALGDDRETLAALTGVGKDTVERREEKVTSREAQHIFKTIFECVADGIVLAEVTNKGFCKANRMFCHMLHYDPEEIKTLGIMDIYPKEYLSRAMEQFERQVRGELTLVKHVPIRRKDASVFYADVNSFPIALDHKTYLMAIFKDLTERQLARNELENSENKWCSLLRNVPDVILNLDRDGTILFINHTLPGYAVGDVVGRTVYDFIPPEQHDRTREAIRTVFESREVLSFETSVIGPDGDLMWYNTRLGPIHNGDKMVSVAQISTDITESKKREKELGTFRTRMARAEWLASLGTLSASLAHEFTQPLTIVRLSLDDALDKLRVVSPPPQTVITGLNEALTQVSDLAVIVKRFRDLAGAHSEKTVEEVDVKAVAERITRLLSESAKCERLVLQLKDMDDLPPVCMNKRDLEQLFFALIENTMQATDGKKDRHLDVSGAVKDRHIELRFSDDCGGIAPENLDRIFEPFFTTKPAGQGTGLGLYIVQKAVSRAGGRVCVQSELGVGSTFSVILPISESRMS